MEVYVANASLLWCFYIYYESIWIFKWAEFLGLIVRRYTHKRARIQTQMIDSNSNDTERKWWKQSAKCMEDNERQRLRRKNRNLSQFNESTYSNDLKCDDNFLNACPSRVQRRRKQMHWHESAHILSHNSKKNQEICGALFYFVFLLSLSLANNVNCQFKSTMKLETRERWKLQIFIIIYCLFDRINFAYLFGTMLHID